jgi:GWxTD domain-containing protein
MKKTKMIGVFVLCAAVFPAAAPAQKKEIPLSKNHETWLKEEVVYIITPREKDVFGKLETEEDRDLFIEEFWKQRDPTPGTPRNEFREEHSRRIDFADKRFGHGPKSKGWRTDQGRVFVILGMPMDVQKISAPDIYPMELWLYRGNPRLGQFAFFRLLFYQQGGSGDFRLYNPSSDRPKNLLSYADRLSALEAMSRAAAIRGSEDLLPSAPRPVLPDSWDSADRQVFQILNDEVAAEAAEATISVIPGSRDARMTVPSGVLLGEINDYPRKKVNDAYALDFLEHKPTVEVSYSIHFMGNQSAVCVLLDPSGYFFLNYVLVPENLSLEVFEDRYVADLKTTFRLADLQGKTLFQQEKLIPVELRKEELKVVEKNSFQLYDAVPVVPGTYTFSILLENTVTKEFTSLDKSIYIPRGDELRLSPLVLAHQAFKAPSILGPFRAFQIGRTQIYPSVNNSFPENSPIYLFFQIYGLSRDLEESGLLEYQLSKGGQVLPAWRKYVRDYQDASNFLEELSALKLSAGTYAFRVVLKDKSGKETLAGRTDFLVSPKTTLSPWVLAQANPPTYDPSYSYILGTQFLNIGSVAQGSDALAKAYSAKPDSVEFAVGYARALLLNHDPAKAKEILLPLANTEKASFDLYESLGKATQGAGEPKDAISWYLKALALKGNIAEILNSLGECHLKLGEKEAALQAWKKSLEINPNQENIKKLVSSIKD